MSTYYAPTMCKVDTRHHGGSGVGKKKEKTQSPFPTLSHPTMKRTKVDSDTHWVTVNR